LRYSGSANTLDDVWSPAETALARLYNVFHLLVALGAEINLGTKTTLNQYTQEEYLRSLLDWVRCSLEWVEKQLLNARKETPSEDEPIPETGWQGCCSHQRQVIKLVRDSHADTCAPDYIAYPAYTLTAIRHKEDLICTTTGYLLKNSAGLILSVTSGMYAARPSPLGLYSQIT
jgi:hypothetical protein